MNPKKRHTHTFTHLIFNAGQLSSKLMNYDICVQVTHPWTDIKKRSGGRSVKSHSKEGSCYELRVTAFLLICRRRATGSSLHYLLSPLLLPHSEPPETYVDNEHDEEDTTGSQFGIGGAGIQILGITPILFGQGGQVAGLGVQCRERFSSLKHLFYVCDHDPLYVLELCVDAAQVPSCSAVNVGFLGFLNISVKFNE